MGFLGWLMLMFSRLVLLGNSSHEESNPFQKPSKEKVENKKDEF
jgi:hypothetical protein